MKTLFLLAVIFLSLGLCPLEAKVRVFSNVEYWLEGTAHEKSDDGVRDREASDDQSLLMENSLNIDIKDAMGVRLGVAFPLSSPRWEVRGSLGYIKGPKFKSVYFFDDHSPFSGFRNIQTETEALEPTFLRVLAEASYDFNLGGKGAFRLNTGVGIARGKMKQSFENIYTLPAGPTFSNSGTETWTGLTYEMGPSFMMRFSKVDVELGMKYMVLPKMGAVTRTYSFDDYLPDLSEFKWNPLGFSLGVHF